MSAQQQQQTLTIDPEQALSLLDQAVSTIQTNRQGHTILATCLAVLRQRIMSDQERIGELETILRLHGLTEDGKASQESAETRETIFNTMGSNHG